MIMAIFKDKEKTKDGRSWYFAVHKKEDSSKVYKSQRYLTRKEAQEAEAVYLLKKQNSKKEFHIVALDYFNYLKTYTKYSTIYTYEKDYNKHIYPFYAHKDIYSINTLDYNLWYDKMAKKGLKSKYLNKINSLLKNIFQYAVQNYNLEYNPVVKTFKESNSKIITQKIRYITKEEFDKFISVADDDMYKLLFEFLFYTGARIGEVICLTWSDIDLENKFVSITKTLYKIHNNKPTSNKTAKNRQIYLNDSLVANLTLYKASKQKFKDFSNSWYVFGDVKTLSTTTIARKKHQYFTDANIHEISIHEFRHSHVSNMVDMYLKSGQNDATKFFLMMSQRLGHSLPVLQKTYMHLFPNTQDEIVNLLNSVT